MLERNVGLRELRLDCTSTSHYVTYARLACSISYGGAVFIAEALRINYTLRSLYLRNNSLQHAGGEALLKTVTEANGTLRTLDLAHSRTTDRSLACLSALTPR